MADMHLTLHRYLQVAKQILKNKDDKTQISLIYANQKPEDILLWDELEEMAANYDNFKVHYVGECPSLSCLRALLFVTAMNSVHAPKMFSTTSPIHGHRLYPSISIRSGTATCYPRASWDLSKC